MKKSKYKGCIENDLIWYNNHISSNKTIYYFRSPTHFHINDFCKVLSKELSKQTGKNIAYGTLDGGFDIETPDPEKDIVMVILKKGSLNFPRTLSRLIRYHYSNYTVVAVIDPGFVFSSNDYTGLLKARIHGKYVIRL